MFRRSAKSDIRERLAAHLATVRALCQHAQGYRDARIALEAARPRDCPPLAEAVPPLRLAELAATQSLVAEALDRSGGRVPGWDPPGWMQHRAAAPLELIAPVEPREFEGMVLRYNRLVAERSQHRGPRWYADPAQKWNRELWCMLEQAFGELPRAVEAWNRCWQEALDEFGLDGGDQPPLSLVELAWLHGPATGPL